MENDWKFPQTIHVYMFRELATTDYNCQLSCIEKNLKLGKRTSLCIYDGVSREDKLRGEDLP
jgi:hypothetical protein